MYHPEDQNLSKNIDIIREYDLLNLYVKDSFKYRRSNKIDDL